MNAWVKGRVGRREKGQALRRVNFCRRLSRLRLLVEPCVVVRGSGGLGVGWDYGDLDFVIESNYLSAGVLSYMQQSFMPIKIETNLAYAGLNSAHVRF